jgi:hypothetical protein
VIIFLKPQSIKIKCHLSPVTSVLIIQMFVAIVVIVVSNHLVSRTLETHTFVASAACHSEATICSHDWHFAVLVGTNSDTVFLHVFLKQWISSFFCFFTSQSLMIMLFAFCAIRHCAHVALEAVHFQHAYLFAARRVTETHDLCVLVDILSDSHVD